VKNTILPRIYRVNQKTRLLDIGCATGNFLRRYREKLGCEVYGVEIDKAAANYARNHSGICVHNGDFLTNNFRSSFFDCITMWWFLEHTHSPTSVLKEAKRILTRDGIVVIGIPNGQSIGRYLFREKWYAYDTPRHLYIFSPRTIQQLLQKTGFKVVGVKYDYSTWDLMGSLQYLLFHEKYLPGKRVQNVQENRIAQLLMMPLGLVSGLLRIAGIMVVYAEKC
jgi:2-polyprenyl-3-methyl-5-hydroxy-6-metoxy-1,4-benzoquinol methylase